MDRGTGRYPSRPFRRRPCAAVVFRRATLDLGCGPGLLPRRYSSAARQRWASTTSCGGANRQRGGAAIHADLFGPLPAAGCWDRILLTDGNIGIGGNPVRTLRRAAELLAPGGIVIAEVDLPSVNSGHELLRWETNTMSVNGFLGHGSMLRRSTASPASRTFDHQHRRDPCPSDRSAARSAESPQVLNWPQV